jgi:hypothetical protein
MQDERRYLLMVRTRGGPDASFWEAVKIPGVGRLLTRAQAETHAQQTGVGSEGRYLMYDRGEQTARFARDESPNSHVIADRETIWSYGEPLRLDMAAVLRDVIANPEREGQAYEAPDPNLFPIPVDATVNRAITRWGVADRHTIERAFDEYVMELGGRRQGDPPCYHVPFTFASRRGPDGQGA